MILKYFRRKTKLTKDYIFTDRFLIYWKDIEKIYLMQSSSQGKFSRNINYSLRLHSKNKKYMVELAELNIGPKEIVDIVINFWSQIK